MTAKLNSLVLDFHLDGKFLHYDFHARLPWYASVQHTR
jgi:hypothetical protein